MLHKSGMSVTQVLHKVCEVRMDTWGVCVGASRSVGVNWVEEGLGQVRQVMAAIV